MYLFLYKLSYVSDFMLIFCHSEFYMYIYLLWYDLILSPSSKRTYSKTCNLRPLKITLQIDR